ncbi:YybS family protein [Sediminibacillus massiliensis]|uniref:YybS family protein n=1 Tax=Sediminibacillus massiliensis TaxID=1926277 RepID=UPI000988835E|nr:YybS family protein [Sediminibacillus massiliensis]
MKNQTLLKQGAVLTALYLLLLFITIFVPFLEMIALFILPLPFLLFASRQGWKPAAMMVVAAAMVSSLFVTVVSFPLTVMAGLGGGLIGSAIHQRLSPYETWARGSIGFVIGLVTTFIYIQWLFSINIVQEINQSVEESMETSQQLLTDLGMNLTEQDMSMITDQMNQVINLLPVILVVIAVFFGFLTQWIGYRLINRLDKQELKFPPFRNFRLPLAVLWIYFGGLLVTWIMSEPGSALYTGADNVVHLAGLFIALQGLSFVFFYAKNKKSTKALPIIAIIIVILFPIIGLYLMRILGIIDLGFQLRDRLNNNQN